MSKHSNYNWSLLVEKQKESGLNIKSFCTQHQLPYQTFLYHRRNLTLSNTSGISFTPVVTTTRDEVLFECSGVSIKVSEDVSIDFLSKLLKASAR